MEFCVSEGHIRVFASVSIPNPNGAFYNWKLEVEHDEQTGKNRTCRDYFFNITTTPSGTNFEALTLRDQTLYITVEGLEDHNRFSLNGNNGNTQDEEDVNPPSPTPPPPPGERHALNVALCRLCFQRVGISSL